MATGSLSIPNPFIVDEISEDNITISASGYKVQIIDATKAGYTPIGLVGFYVISASSGGTGVTYISVRTANLTIEDGTPVAMISCRNHSSSAAKVMIGAKVLYIKN